MDATDVVEHVRSENNTELSRLGSSKSLYADTEGEMEPDAVLSAMADTLAGAAEAFEGWGEPFAGLAATERDHYEAVAGELDGHDPGQPPAVVAALEGRETAAERLGAALGYVLVVAEKASQATGFFTGQADPGTASLFRGFDGDYEDRRADLVDELAGHDAEAAAAAATAVVGAAYEEYVERLEGMGINPKPVC